MATPTQWAIRSGARGAHPVGAQVVMTLSISASPAGAFSVSVDDRGIGDEHESEIRLHRVAVRHKHADRREEWHGQALVLGGSTNKLYESQDDPLVVKATAGQG